MSEEVTLLRGFDWPALLYLMLSGLGLLDGAWDVERSQGAYVPNPLEKLKRYVQMIWIVIVICTAFMENASTKALALASWLLRGNLKVGVRLVRRFYIAMYNC